MADRFPAASGLLGTARVGPLEILREATLAKTYVSLGSRRTASPHEFYRYPARFPPTFARAAIEAFTAAGDLVLDPFAGGGTTLVESRLLGRPAIGSDLNQLAVFVSQVKTRVLSEAALQSVTLWGERLAEVSVDACVNSGDLTKWIESGYLRNADDPEIWPVRDVLDAAIRSLSTVDEPSAAALARCAVLRTGQWALDMRSEIPSASETLDSLMSVTSGMVEAARSYAAAARAADKSYELRGLSQRVRVIEQGVPGLADRLAGKAPAPALVLTSPPYPGVYVNYHRWKVRGRRETPAPYWIADRQDGNGLAYYTMAARADRTLRTYFAKLEAAFADVARICDRDTKVVQMVGFHDPEGDLPRYLHAMEAAGFSEVLIPDLSTEEDGRLWRSVPNRRWWATNAPEYRTAAEVVLVHKLR